MNFFIGQPVRIVRHDNSQNGIHWIDGEAYLYKERSDLLGCEGIVTAKEETNRALFYEIAVTGHRPVWCTVHELEPIVRNPDKEKTRELETDPV